MRLPSYEIATTPSNQLNMKPTPPAIVNLQGKEWRPRGDSNPCFQRERLTS